MPRTTIAILAWSVLLACCGAAVQAEAVPAQALPAAPATPPPPPVEWFGTAPLAEWTHLTGNWGGWRDRLADAGLKLDASLINECSEVLISGVPAPAGGPDRALGDRYLLNLALACDLERLVGIPKALVDAHYQLARGDDAIWRVGDAQGWSNINAHIDQISELWYQQRWGTVGASGDLVRIKLGKVDTNTEFECLPALSLFLSGAVAGYSPTIICFPAFPNQAMSANAFLQPIENLTFAIGCYDGSFVTRHQRTGAEGAAPFFAHGLDHDKLWLAQATPAWGGADGWCLPGLAEFGLWRLSGDLDTFDGGGTGRTSGWYMEAQQDLWNGAEQRAFTIIVQAGGADQAVCSFRQHLGGGFWLRGTFPGRAADGFGFYISDAAFSDATDGATGGRIFPARHETAWEWNYAWQATGWLALQFVTVYIRHPGATSDPGASWLGALRTEVTF